MYWLHCSKYEKVGLPWVCIRANKNISIVTLKLKQKVKQQSDQREDQNQET